METNSIEILSDFFEYAKTGALFTSNDPQFYQNLRNQIVERLYDLLVWQRAELEQSKGLFWPYCGSRHSTRRLNQRFKTVFRDLGYSWTEDIAPLGSSGANRYLSRSDYEIFRKEFEQLFGIFQQWGKSPIRLTID
ncbi:MAG: hypothetical protein JRE58_10210 [Deltaproteobacteria bacterium]|nr:hypothetical protein [Deltaproteobacteria bacterium]